MTDAKEPKRRPWVLIGIFWTLWVAVAVVATASWLNRPADRPSPLVRVEVQPSATAEPISGTIPSREATEELGRRFDELVNTGDQDGLVDLVDWNVLLGRAFGDTGFTPEQGTALVEMVREMSRGEKSLLLPFIQHVEAGATFSFRKVLDRDGRPVALCRLVPHNGSPTFYELTSVDREGRTRIADVYSHGTGDSFSSVARRLIVPALAEREAGGAGRVANFESDFFKYRDGFKELSAAFREARYADALSAYDRLPESLRQDRLFHILAASAAGQVDEARYVALVESFERAHPGDPALLSTEIGYHFVRGELVETIEAIRRLDEHLGGDAVLKTQWASAALEAGNAIEAERVISLAVEEEPDLPRARATAIVTAASVGDETLAMQRLRTFDQEFGANPDVLKRMLSSNEKSMPFADSEAFRQWEAEVERDQ